MAVAHRDAKMSVSPVRLAGARRPHRDGRRASRCENVLRDRSRPANRPYPRVRGVVDLIANDPQRFDKLASGNTYSLFESVCDADGRRVLAELADAEPRTKFRYALARADQCIATRSRLEPLLRTWLGHGP